VSASVSRRGAWIVNLAFGGFVNESVAVPGAVPPDSRGIFEPIISIYRIAAVQGG